MDFRPRILKYLYYQQILRKKKACRSQKGNWIWHKLHVTRLTKSEVCFFGFSSLEFVHYTATRTGCWRIEIHNFLYEKYSVVGLRTILNLQSNAVNNANAMNLKCTTTACFCSLDRGSHVGDEGRNWYFATRRVSNQSFSHSLLYRTSTNSKHRIYLGATSPYSHKPPQLIIRTILQTSSLAHSLALNTASLHINITSKTLIYSKSKQSAIARSDS